MIEAVKIYIASASAVIDEKARIMEERATQAPEEPDLGACCRLVHWALIATGKALEPEATYACRANNDRHALAVICDEQRQHLLWCKASLEAICTLLRMDSCETVGDERLALAALIPDLEQSIALLHPAALRLPTAEGVPRSVAHVEVSGNDAATSGEANDSALRSTKRGK